MHITVVGTGYVGLVVGACLAESGNDVVCADVDPRKIDTLRHSRIPIYEPGLEDLVKRNQEQQRLNFTTDVPSAIAGSEVIFIAVGTPPDEDGSADLCHVLDVGEKIGRHMTREIVVVTKSTLPVGTAAMVQSAVARHAKLGPDSFSYVAADGQSTSGVATVTLTVNPPADSTPPVVVMTAPSSGTPSPAPSR